MIKQRSIATCIILSLVTCGIYGLVWFISLTDDTNQLTGAPYASGGKALLYTLLTCGIYGFFWVYKLGEKVDNMKQKMGKPASNSAVLYLVLTLFGLGIVAYCLAQSEINEMVAGIQN